jgi:hypothetical protein
VNVIVPDAAPDTQLPDPTSTASLFPPPLTRTSYPAPLLVSIPVGHGVNVTVAGVPPINALEIVCDQFNAVVA